MHNYKLADDVLIDSSLCNFADKKRQNATLVGIDQMKAMEVRMHALPTTWICSQHSWGRNTINEINIPDIIDVILKIGLGHLCLAGGAIRDIMMNKYPNDYDIFFYDIDINDATILLQKCVNAIVEECDDCHFARSQYVTTIIRHEDEITDECKIQFIKRIYKTKDQILLGFDLAPSRIGWAPDCGIFTTIDCAAAYATDKFVLDLTQRSTSFGARISKYTGNKGFGICVPNCSIPESVRQIHTPNGKITIYNNHLNVCFGSHTSDYDSDGEYYSNVFLIDDRKHCVTFTADSYDDIMKLPDDIVRDSMLRGRQWEVSFDNMPKINPRTAEKILGAHYAEWVHKFYIEHDYAAAQKIWYDRQDYCVDCGIAIAAEINLPKNQWKVANPGEQRFGMFNPIDANPRDWLGAYYVPFVVGIPDDIVHMIRRGCITLPNEIIETIISYLFWQLAREAKRRLIGGAE